MKRSTNFWALGLALGALAAGAALGQEPRPSLTLAAAFARADANNPQLLALRARSGAHQLTAAAAALAAKPRVTLGSGLGVTDTPSRAFGAKLDAGRFRAADFRLDRLNHPEVLGYGNAYAAFEWPVDLAGRVRVGAAAAQAGAESFAAQSEEARLDVLSAVATVFHQGALVEEALVVTERALAAARAREDELAARRAEGAALSADLLRARARRREREAELAEHQAERLALRAELARWLGANSEQELGALVPPGPAAEPGAADPVARALDQRPQVAAARAQVEAARWQAEGVARERRPELGVWGRLQADAADSLSGQLSGAVGVGFTWRWLDPGQAERAAAAHGQLAAAELDLRAAEAQVRTEVVVALGQLAAARERASASADGSREGREALRVVTERRQAGLATLTDELETEAAALAAELRELSAGVELQLARLRLARATGDLGAARESAGEETLP